MLPPVPFPPVASPPVPLPPEPLPPDALPPSPLEELEVLPLELPLAEDEVLPLAPVEMGRGLLLSDEQEVNPAPTNPRPTSIMITDVFIEFLHGPQRRAALSGEVAHDVIARECQTSHGYKRLSIKLKLARERDTRRERGICTTYGGGGGIGCTANRTPGIALRTR